MKRFSKSCRRHRQTPRGAIAESDTYGITIRNITAPTGLTLNNPAQARQGAVWG
ncbi:MAG: hypothetical protein J6X62_03165 [Bacteroidales bacterium]|nr:hypothetical protein [Bacteroidales bacterium]